jgi:hypothetical protein
MSEVLAQRRVFMTIGDGVSSPCVPVNAMFSPRRGAVCFADSGSDSRHGKFPKVLGTIKKCSD